MPAPAIALPGQNTLLGVLLLLIAYRVVKTTTDWTVKSALNYVQNLIASETTSRDEKNGNKRAVEIDEKLEQEIAEKADKISNYERMIRSLKRKNVSKGRIIEQYWKPLPAIIITFFNDYSSNSGDKKFIKDYITENNQASMLTANTYAIPPHGFPDRFDAPEKVGRKEIKTWIEDDIIAENPDGKAVICQASAVDLRRVFSHTDYDSHSFARQTIEQALDIENILSRNNVHRLLARDNVNLSRAIESGDIAFLLSRYISDEELELIHQHQDKIRDSLNDPPLRKIAQDSFTPELADAISPYIEDPKIPAQKAVEEAKLWHNELQG